MIGRQRLVVEHVEARVTNVPAFERCDQRGLVGQRTARSVDVYDAFLHARDPLGGEKAACLVAERQVHRHDVGAGEQGVDVDQRHVDLGVLGAIPADHVHSHAFADARHLAADAAEADHAQRFAEELHAFVRCPYAAAHLAIHAREIARAGPQQRDGVLGDRGVTVALDDVHLDAALIELTDIHVARRPGAEENDVLEFRALRHQRRRHVGMVVDCDVVAADDVRQLVARK